MALPLDGRRSYTVHLLFFLLCLVLITAANPAPPSVDLYAAMQPIFSKASPNTPAPQEHIDRSMARSDFSSDFSSDYLQHQHARVSRLAAIPRSRSAYLSSEAEMRQLFSALTSLNHDPKRQAEIPERINRLRTTGYKFAPRVDPGLHLPFGTPWEFDEHGPYPASRLAGAPRLNVGRVDAEAYRVELENALEALDKQTFFEADRRAGEKIRMLYTDDTILLRSAIDHYRQIWQHL